MQGRCYIVVVDGRGQGESGGPWWRSPGLCSPGAVITTLEFPVRESPYLLTFWVRCRANPMATVYGTSLTVEDESCSVMKVGCRFLGEEFLVEQ